MRAPGHNERARPRPFTPEEAMKLFKSILVCLGFSIGAAFSAPYHGEILTLKQPDGTLVKARAFGDEYYARLESLDGHTLTQDPATRWFQYARLNAAGTGFVSTGVAYLAGGNGPSAKPLASTAPAGVPKNERLPTSIRMQKHAENLAILRKNLPAPKRGTGPQVAAAAAALTGNVRGLTLLIDFNDDVSALPQTEISNYLNQQGYSNFGNNGSVRDYFSDISGGKLVYTNHTTAYYRALHPKTYYTDPAIGYTVRAQELIVEALQALDAQGFDFSTLSVDESGAIRAINMFYAGYIQNAWAEGLWPHQSYMGGRFSADGVTTGAYQTTNIGESLALATFCHENGHMLFGWPDLYDYTYESAGAGNYCLMAYQGPSNNPVPPNPYLRSIAGWETATVIPAVASPVTFTHLANSLTHFRYNNPTAENEFFLIESRRWEGRNAGLPDEGLLIWHIDTWGSNSNNDMTPTSHYQVSVEQADGLFQLENNMGYGGDGDLFHAGYRDQFADWTLPDSKWWSGERSGLNIVNIGPLGASQSFTVQSGESQTINIGNPGLPGSASESGGTLTLEGGGADIWGTADQFFFRYSSLRGDGEVIARIQSLENTDAWAKAGVMLRESADPGSRNAFMALTPGNGVTFQSRTTTNGGTAYAATPAVAPRWVKLARRGGAFTGYHSANGVDWIAFGTATIPMGQVVLAGLAVTSHLNTTLATAVVTNHQVIPSPWTLSPIGAPAQTGAYTLDNSANAITVTGGGADFWGASDQFHYLQQGFSGEGRIVARLNSLGNTDPWAKAGLMFRSSLDANSANVFQGIAAANGAHFQRRTAAGAASTSNTVGGIAPPRWIKLEARNGLLIGSQSANGTAWTEVGREAAVFPVAYAGLAVTSHNPGQTTTAVFDKVEIQHGFPSLYLGQMEFAQVSGNGDEDVNPGEEFIMGLGLNNSGQGTAKGVTATLSTTDACITLVNSTGAYGDILAGANAAPRPYRFKASASCPGGSAQMNLDIADAYGEHWQVPFTVTIMVRSSVRGTIRTPAGPLPAGAYVWCGGYRVSYPGVIQSNGSYVVDGIPPGTYTCYAGAPEYDNTAGVMVTVPPNKTGVDFLLSRALISVNRAAFAESLAAGQNKVVPMTVSNPGDAPLLFQAFNPQTGYQWRDSDAPGGPAYAWTDIKATGTRLAMTDGMSGTVGFRTLSFPFPIYGIGKTSLVIAPTGYVAFQDHYPLSFNYALPADYAVPNMIAGFWDEIGPTASQGGIWFQEYPDRAVVQYDSVPRSSGTGNHTFQIVLYRDGVIRFFYKSMTDPYMGGADGATVGIQNAAGDRGINVVTDAAYVKNNLAVEFKPVTRDWLSVSPASGTVNPGASQRISVILDAFGLNAGLNKSRLVVTHNAPDQGPLYLPATLRISEASGGVRREVWTGVAGTALTALLALPAYPNSPNVTGTLTSFEAPQGYGDNYGQRLRGYVTAPATGDYTFWIAGDDQCELRLSTDDHPGRAVPIAKVSGWTAFRGWNTVAEQKSALIRLEAGKRYFIEALHKEGGAGDHVSVGWQGPGIAGDAERPIPGTRLTPFDPAAWTGLDIGNPGRAGSQAVSGNCASVTGGGADIWGTADQFRFLYKPMTGDGEITAKVASIRNTDAWAKGGVMIRETLAADSRHALTAVSAASGLAFQRRIAPAGPSLHTGLAGAAPRWVRLRRTGNLFTAFVSADGAAWTQMGAETIAMGTAVWAGLAVTSHDNAALSTDEFESISFPLR
jgi:M6 family metalloprotease-like protein